MAIYGAKDVILVKTKPGFWTSDLVERYKGKLYRKAKTDGSHNQLSEQDTVPFSNKWSGSLVLVDGVELIAEDLDRLKPDDIESLSVVEDSIFTAAYGAKGANSVILIKTKLGFWTPNLIEKYYKDR